MRPETEAHGTHFEQEAEHGAHAGLANRGGKRLPPVYGPAGQVRFERGRALAVGSCPRTVPPDGVLELFGQVAPLFVVPSEPRRTSTDISIVLAPLMAVTSAQPWHSRLVPNAP